MRRVRRHRHARAVDYQFCPKCGGPLQPVQLKRIEPPRLVCMDCHFVFYLDPKIAAATIVPYRGGIAMVKRSVEPGYGKWVIPGGFVDRGETPEECAVRETREEANLVVRLTGLVGIYSYAGPSVVVLAYAAERVRGVLRASDESSAARAFPARGIPWRRIAFESTTRALRDYLSARGGRARRTLRPRAGFTPGPQLDRG